MTELTAEQRRAVETERNVLITAGAGTGKTRTMTERIIRKLDEIDHIQQLLVVTFTEDAASEVRHRVYGALLEQIRTGDPSRREHFERIRDQFPNHHISTMHTFFAALLRQHGHRLSEEDGGRVEPDFVILEGAEQRALLRDSVESVLDEAAQNRHSPLREPLALWLRSGVRRSQLCAAVEAIISRRIELRSWLEKARSLSFEALFQAHEAWGRALLKRLQAAFFSDSEVVQLLEHIRTCAPASDANDRLAKLREAVLRAFQEENPAGLLECLLTKQQRPRSFGNVGSQRNWDPEVLETLRGALTRLARRVEEEQSLRWDWDPSLESEAMALARALALLAEAALEQYRARKLARHLVDFVDLEDFAGRLVRQPEVRRLLHRQFRAIFIDEFQDTNRHQWGTFRAIAADPRTEKIPPGRLFLVGDEKQAIYEFRGGEVEVCRIAGQEVEEQLEFTVNFRSGSNLLLFTNAFFDRLLTGEAPYEARPQALAHREDRQPPVRFRPGEGTVVHWVLPVEGSRVGRQELRREARWIARHLREILDGAHSERYPGIAERARSGEPTIGILLRRSTHQRLYEDALRAYGVPFVAARGRGFFQRQEVRDLRNALIFLNDPEDDLALVGLLRSPLFGCSDLGLIRLRMAQEELGTLNFWDTLLRLEERGPSELEARFGEDAPAIYKAVVLLRRWQDRVGRKGIGLLLAQIVAETGLVAALSARPNGQQEVLNVEKFIDLAREFEAGAFPTLADFLLYLESQDAGDEEGDADLPEGGAVQILTVHRAKGLEWDLVVVPDTAGEFQTRVERAGRLRRAVFNGSDRHRRADLQRRGRGQELHRCGAGRPKPARGSPSFGTISRRSSGGVFWRSSDAFYTWPSLGRGEPCCSPRFAERNVSRSRWIGPPAGPTGFS
ncbi:MAG: hypothetical protein KatS3mg115_1241 [Candidatus Poribacteria bacterium]|nr:MAG: hypothetical protein KatS3mg115_1241 [Candidatus Poribacteria bacterium]